MSIRPMMEVRCSLRRLPREVAVRDASGMVIRCRVRVRRWVFPALRLAGWLLTRVANQGVDVRALR